MNAMGCDLFWTEDPLPMPYLALAAVKRTRRPKTRERYDGPSEPASAIRIHLKGLKPSMRRGQIWRFR